MRGDGVHIPVLCQEVCDGLQIRPGMNILDATVGNGGHAQAFLERSGPGGKLLGVDRDAQMVERGRTVLAPFGDRVRFVHDSYRNILDHAEMLAWVSPLRGILLDVGIASVHVDEAKRGFSFQREGPLDMRFDQTSPLTAAAILHSWPEEELRMIFQRYGEERHAGLLARAIVHSRKSRPLTTTTDLRTLIERTVHGRRGRIHPATRVFQALRIAVNDELAQLEAFLPIAMTLLAPGGRCAIITFHSLEDRLVKHTFRNMARPTDATKAIAKLITKKPIRPAFTEIQKNPRARSAKLRIIEKI